MHSLKALFMLALNSISHTCPESIDQVFDQTSQSFQLEDQLERLVERVSWNLQEKSILRTLHLSSCLIETFCIPVNNKYSQCAAIAF